MLLVVRSASRGLISQRQEQPARAASHQPPSNRFPFPVSRSLSLRFFLEHLHGNGDEPVQLIVRCAGQERLCPHVIFASRVAVEQPAQECHQRDAFELRAPPRVLTVIGRSQQRLEAMGVAERLRRERGDHLAEADVALGEWLGLPFGPEEDRANDRRPRTDRYDDDRSHIAQVERGARVLQHRIVRRIGNEDGVARLERPLELRIAIQVDDEVPDRWVLVAGHEAHIGVAAREIDRAAVEPERFAQLAGDRLQNVYEMQ